MKVSRRSFIKSFTMAAIGAGLVTIPMVDSVGIAARIEAFDFDLALVNLYTHRWMAEYFRGTPLFASKYRKYLIEASVLREKLQVGA